MPATRRNPTEREAKGWRYELKFPCAEAALAAMRACIRCHWAGFRAAYPPRRVNNIYFDTLSWDNIESNLAGVADRGKLRLRWYGDDVVSVLGTLEWKRKRGDLGLKIARALRNPLDLTRMNWGNVLRSLRGEDLGPLAPVAGINCRPAVLNRYRREYLVSRDGLIRLTVDTAMEVYLQTFSGRPNLRRMERKLPLAVVEIKADASCWERVAEVAGDFPLSPAAHSKYVVGLYDQVGFSWF